MLLLPITEKANQEATKTRQILEIKIRVVVVAKAVVVVVIEAEDEVEVEAADVDEVKVEVKILLRTPKNKVQVFSYQQYFKTFEFF